jgi:predicted dithiol-disulfide oxidoreductase (DUF899 family)
MSETIAHPQITSGEEWLAARKALLAREKQLTKAHDEVAAARRRSAATSTTTST